MRANAKSNLGKRFSINYIVTFQGFKSLNEVEVNWICFKIPSNDWFGRNLNERFIPDNGMVPFNGKNAHTLLFDAVAFKLFSVLAFKEVNQPLQVLCFIWE